MQFDSLIFDLDGTLWDCTQASSRAVNRAFAQVGVEKTVSPEFVRSISGKPSTECDEIILSQAPDAVRKELSNVLESFEIEAVGHDASDSLYPGVKAGLETLAGYYRLYVVSNCGQEYLRTFLQQSAVGALFLDSECYGRTLNSKAENIRDVIERQELRSPCYIGDTAGDEEAAAGAQIPFFHVRYGFGSPRNHHVSFDDFDSLTTYFVNEFRKTL